MSHDATTDVLKPDEISIPAGHPLARLPWIGAVSGGIGIVGSAVLGFSDPRRFAFSWLVAVLFFLSLALGALYFVLVHTAMQGGWGIVVRRIAEDVMATVPLFALLFVPVLFTMGDLFPWVAGTAELHAKAKYLNPTFFTARATAYFVCWSLIAIAYARGSRKQDATGDLAISRRLRRFAGIAIVVVGICQTFAAVDWIMSLEPEWYSTIFGVYWFAGSLVAFFALLAVAVVALQRWGLLTDVVGPEHYHDMGKLLFAFTVFWAYIGFSQYFLIWYGNMPEETIFFRQRLQGSWSGASFLLAAGHFAVPFFFFMGRSVKRRPAALAVGGVWLLAMHLLDMYWLIMPSLDPGGAHVSLLDFTTLLAAGGLFVGAAGWLMRRAPLVPVRDPRLPESIAFENA